MPTVATAVKLLPSVERRIWKLCRPAELSIQARLIWLAEATLAVRLVGGPISGRTRAWIVALPVLELAEAPLALDAATR